MIRLLPMFLLLLVTACGTDTTRPAIDGDAIPEALERIPDVAGMTDAPGYCRGTSGFIPDQCEIDTLRVTKKANNVWIHWVQPDVPLPDSGWTVGYEWELRTIAGDSLLLTRKKTLPEITSAWEIGGHTARVLNDGGVRLQVRATYRPAGGSVQSKNTGPWRVRDFANVETTGGRSARVTVDGYILPSPPDGDQCGFGYDKPCGPDANKLPVNASADSVVFRWERANRGQTNSTNWRIVIHPPGADTAVYDSGNLPLTDHNGGGVGEFTWLPTHDGFRQGTRFVAHVAGVRSPKLGNWIRLPDFRIPSAVSENPRYAGDALTISATALSFRQIVVRWESAQGEHYDTYGADGRNGTWMKLNNRTAYGGEWLERGLTSNTTRCYQVKAIGPTTVTSNVACATTPGTGDDPDNPTTTNSCSQVTATLEEGDFVTYDGQCHGSWDFYTLDGTSKGKTSLTLSPTAGFDWGYRICGHDGRVKGTAGSKNLYCSGGGGGYEWKDVPK